MKLLVTTSLGQNAEVTARAKELAHELQAPFYERKKQSVKSLLAIAQCLLLVYREKLVLVNPDGNQLSFHPDTAMLRIKAPHDALLEILGEQSLTILDTTMGLASDSLVMAYAGHQVTALESSSLVHLIVSHGLECYHSGNAALDKAMRSIETHCCDSLIYLTQQPPKSVDVIYVDPMFSKEISESKNLDGLRPLADKSPLTEEFLEEAKRVARQKIILKAHFRDSIFENFGFRRLVRPNQKFHYGVLTLIK